MNLTTGTIFPQDGKWFMVLKNNKKTVILRELLNFNLKEPTKLNLGGKFKADKI